MARLTIVFYLTPHGPRPSNYSCRPHISFNIVVWEVLGLNFCLVLLANWCKLQESESPLPCRAGHICMCYCYWNTCNLMLFVCLAVKSRTLFSFADDPDRATWDTSSSCGYHKVLLNWLSGGFSRTVKHQQSTAVWADTSHVDHDDNNREAGDEIRDEMEGREMDVVVEAVSASDHNESWTMTPEFIMASQLGIVTTELNVTYTAAAEVISVLE